MDEDGSNLTRLTDDPELDQSPAISPDRTKIVFQSTRGGVGYNNIWVMNADGSNQTQLTDSLKTDLRDSGKIVSVLTDPEILLIPTVPRRESILPIQMDVPAVRSLKNSVSEMDTLSLVSSAEH